MFIVIGRKNINTSINQQTKRYLSCTLFYRYIEFRYRFGQCVEISVGCARAAAATNHSPGRDRCARRHCSRCIVWRDNAGVVENQHMSRTLLHSRKNGKMPTDSLTVIFCGVDKHACNQSNFCRRKGFINIRISTLRV